MIKSKILYSNREEDVTIRVRCHYNMETDHNTINSEFIKNNINYKTKSLYSLTQDGITTRVRCHYNLKTDNITISSEFSNNNHPRLTKSVSNIKRKNIYFSAENDVVTTIRCIYNIDTNNIRIGSTEFRKYQINHGSKINKDCSMYLGITVAEQVLSKVFDNVKRMPITNPGFDFICGKGYKIDVKSSTLRKHWNQWIFGINENTIADYFLCIAFDDRENLNPEHLWLIPGKILSDKKGTSISKNTLDRWSEYELTDKLIDIINCCDKMKVDNDK